VDDKKKATEDLANATKQREKQNAEFQLAEKQLLEAIGKFNSALGVMRTQVEEIDRERNASEQVGVDELSEDLVVSLLQEAPGVYKGSSAQIFGLLQELVESNGRELERRTQDEADAAALFQDEAAQLEAVLARAKDCIAEESATLAQSIVNLEGAKGDLKTAAADLKVAEGLLATAETAKAEETSENNKQQQTNANMMSAINQVIAILDTDSMHAVGSKHTALFFLQTSVARQPSVAEKTENSKKVIEEVFDKVLVTRREREQYFQDKVEECYGADGISLNPTTGSIGKLYSFIAAKKEAILAKEGEKQAKVDELGDQQVHAKDAQEAKETSNQNLQDELEVFQTAQETHGTHKKELGVLEAGLVTAYDVIQNLRDPEGEYVKEDDKTTWVLQKSSDKYQIVPKVGSTKGAAACDNADFHSFAKFECEGGAIWEFRPDGLTDPQGIEYQRKSIGGGSDKQARAKTVRETIETVDIPKDKRDKKESMNTVIGLIGGLLKDAKDKRDDYLQAFKEANTLYDKKKSLHDDERKSAQEALKLARQGVKDAKEAIQDIEAKIGVLQTELKSAQDTKDSTEPGCKQYSKDSERLTKEVASLEPAIELAKSDLK
jgi:hypothetical protein